MTTLTLILGLLFAIMPVMELRAAIPLLLTWSIQTGTNYQPFIILAILLNITTILFIMIFLDFIHHKLIRYAWYKKQWDKWVHNKLRKKVKKLEQKKEHKQYLGLLLFIALPLPGTGVWTSTTISWLLGMNKKTSFLTIAIGASIAGIIITVISLGVLNLL